MTFIIKANTPEDMRDQIVQWLRDQAIIHSTSARIAERKKVTHDHTMKSAAYTSAADFIQLIKIEPKHTVPTMVITRKCPKCGTIHPSDVQCYWNDTLNETPSNQ